MINYVYPCACGCGVISEPIGKEYRRLIYTKWYANGCEPKDAQKKECFGGFLVEKQNGKVENF